MAMTRLAAAGLGALVLALAVLTGCSDPDPRVEITAAGPDEQTVTGVVTVASDRAGIKQITIGEGTPDAVCICPSTGAGERLAGFAGQRVRATGTLVAKAGRRVLTVRRVEPLTSDRR